MLLLLNDYNPQIALIWLLPLYLELDFFLYQLTLFLFLSVYRFLLAVWKTRRKFFLLFKIFLDTSRKTKTYLSLFMYTSYVIRICKKILPVGMIFYFWLHKRLASKTEMMNFRMNLEQKKYFF